MSENILSGWLYKGNQFPINNVPDTAVGFIYVITQISTGKKYIGRKMVFKTVTKTVKGKKKRSKAHSDWPGYWSSSPYLQQLVKEIGQQDFKREILIFCSSKGSMSYLEEMSLYLTGALEGDEFINGNIRSKIFANWVKVDEAKELRATLKSLSLTK